MQKLRGGFASRAFTFDRKKTWKTDPPCPTSASLQPSVYLYLFLCFSFHQFFFIYKFLYFPFEAMRVEVAVATVCFRRFTVISQRYVFVLPYLECKGSIVLASSSLLLQRPVEQICFPILVYRLIEQVQKVTFQRVRQMSHYLVKMSYASFLCCFFFSFLFQSIKNIWSQFRNSLHNITFE